MPSLNSDLHGNVPDQAPAALLLIDVINDLEFPGGEELLPHAREMAEHIAKLKQEATRRGIPTIYVNDNFGRWRSDFHTQIERCLDPSVRGHQITRKLLPGSDDYFVLKPKNSGFFSTALDILLQYLRVHTVILTGLAGNNCVLFTAHDAYLRDFRIIVPADCVASINRADNDYALKQISLQLKGDVRPSSELDWEEISRTTVRAPRAHSDE